MIHQYKLNGYNIVIDVYSGAIHWVDDVAYDIIRLFCEKEKKDLIEGLLCQYRGRADVTKEDLEETYEDIEDLRRQGKLFTEDIFRPLARELTTQSRNIKALCLHVAHSCDLTCSYCFAGGGKFHGKSALMTEEVAKRAVDFLLTHSGRHRTLDIDFFGGEPLLNFSTVKATVRYAHSLEAKYGKNIRFTLTTNGTHIDRDVIDFVNKECYNVVLSLDGRKQVHDRERKLRDGRGSYDLIVPKFQELVKARGGRDYYIRGTFTHYNPDFLEDIRHMLDLGFRELSMEPVVTEPGSRFALTEDDYPLLENQYEELAREMIRRADQGRPFTFYHYMLNLQNGPCIYKRVTGCGSGTEYLAVTPQGDLYPCHRFVGDKAFRMGDIWTGVEREDLRDAFASCNAYTRSECDTCWARLHCSGGCAANAYYCSGDVRGIYEYGCRLFRKRMECAIMVQVALADKERQSGARKEKKPDADQ